jgi:hypothetical protein
VLSRAFVSLTTCAQEARRNGRCTLADDAQTFATTVAAGATNVLPWWTATTGTVNACALAFGVLVCRIARKRVGALRLTKSEPRAGICMDRCQVRSISEQRRKKVWLMSESQRVSDCASAVLDARMCRRRSPHGRAEWFALVQAQTTPKSAVASWPVRTRAGVCACNGCAMNLTSRFRCGTGSGTTSIAPVPHAPHLCNSRPSKREERTAKHIFLLACHFVQDFCMPCARTADRSSVRTA